MFTVQKEKSDTWIKNSTGNIVTSQNIDSYLPIIDDTEASSLLKSLQDVQNQVNAGTMSWDDYFKTCEGGQRYLIDFVQNTNLQTASTQDLVKANQQAREAAIAQNAALQQQTLGYKAATVATKAFAVAGNMLLFMAISKGISLAVTAIDNYIHRIDNLKEAAEEAKSAIDTIKSDFDSLTSTTNDVKERFAELAQGVENLGKVNQSRGTLSTDDYDEFLDLSNQLAELFPQLTKGYDDNGNAILDLSGNVDTIVGSLDNLVSVQQKLANQEILEKMPDVWAGYTVDLDEYTDTLEEAQKKIDSYQTALNKLSDISDDGKITVTNSSVHQRILEAAEKIGLDNGKVFGNSLSALYSEKRSYSGRGPSKFKSAEWDFSSLTEAQLSQLKNELGSLASEYEDTVQLTKSKIESANSEMSSYINTWLSTDAGARWNFSQMDTGMQNVVKDVLINSDWISQLPNNIKSDWDEVSNWLQQEFLYAINNIDSEEIYDSLIDAFNNCLSIESIENLISQLTETEGFDKDNPLIIYLETRKKDAQEFDDAISKFGDNDKTTLEKFFKAKSINDSSEINYWNNVTKGAKNAAEAIKMYNDAKKNANKADIPLLSISSTIDQLNTQLKPAFDSLKSAWQDIFTNDGFTLDSVSTEMLSSIQNTISELNEIEGVSIDTSSYENWAKILADTSSTDDDVRAGFNALANSIVNGVSVTKEFNEETKDICTKLLEEMDIENAEEIVLDNLNNAKIKQKIASIEFSEAAADEIRELISYGNQLGLTSQEVYGLYLQQLLVNNDPIQTKNSILQLIGLCQAGSETADTLVNLYKIMDAISKGQQKLATGELTETQAVVTKSEIEKLQSEMSDRINGMISNTDVDWSGSSKDTSSSSSSSSTDAWLEEYQRKLEELQDMLDMELINEREFYDQSEALLNAYLKDTPAHIEKYAEEISDAEKTLHDNWVSAFDFEKGTLDDRLSDKLITEIEYYKELAKLNNAYYKPSGTLSNGSVISDAQIQSVKEYLDVLQSLNGDADINSNPAFIAAFEKISATARESGESVESLVEAYNEVLEGDGRFGSFAEEFEDNCRDIRSSLKDLYEDIFDELNSSVDELQSAFSTISDAVKEYSQNQALSIDTVQELLSLDPAYLSMLMDENGQLQLNQEAYERLAEAKLEQMVSDMGLSVAEQILALETVEQAKAALEAGNANMYLAETDRTTADAAVENALQTAYNRSVMQNDSSIYEAAQMLAQSYENAKRLIPMAGFDTASLSGSSSDASDSDAYSEQFNWIETLLEKISDKTSKLVDKVEKFYSWQKQNAMINRAVKATDKEISQNRLAYQAYMRKANSVGLSSSYVKKIQNGTLSIEDITNEKLADRIDAYQDWYDKAQACLETIEDLYDQQRDLIKQKLDNVLSYYDDLDSYLSSITSKVESLISLNDSMGKRSSLTELVEQFASISDQLESVTTKNAAGVTITEGSLGDSKKVAEAVNRDRQELADAIQSEIDNLDVKESGTYTKLLNNIAKTQAQLEKYESKGWDTTKAKQYEKLTAQLESYYALQAELDENATSNTIANYSKVYAAYLKLQNKLDSGETLSKSEQKKYESYTSQIDALREQGSSALNKLYDELAEVNGTAAGQSEADKIRNKIDGMQSDLESTATYQNLLNSIQTVEDKLATLDGKGYDNLTKSQKNTYDKLKAHLEDYYAQKEALDENATAANITEYNKIYLAWKKLQDKLDSGGNLSESQWKKYNTYTKQLESYADEKADTISKLNDSLEEALNPSDKLEQIEKTYEESAEGIYESYQSQIDAINGESTGTQQYQKLLAKAQKLEQKKDTKGLSPSEQAALDKYNAELEALEKGATGSNIAEYMKTWEAWYKLQQKLDNGETLSASKAAKYDTYRAQLEAWNEEKQTQIDDLLSLMEDDLAELQKTYTENVSDAESEINDYYASLYDLAKQIAEYNLTSLEAQLEYLESCISYYKELVSLYDTFSGEKLTKLLTDLDENALSDQAEVYAKYLERLQEKYDTALSEMGEYNQLLDALDSDDFEKSMDLFDKAMQDYRDSGNTAMAEKLQSVLDLLNERAIDADNWGKYADEWANEWETALASAKQELISTASEIQEVNDALREISFKNITDAIDRLDTAADQLSSIASLIQDDWLFEPDGSLSEYGLAKTALLVSQLEDAQARANEYLNLYNEIQDSKDTYASESDYMAALNEALQNYYDTLGDAASLENSIMDIMNQAAEEELENLKAVIEARKNALQAKKDYYDYDKTIKNAQKEVDSLKAQIAALEALGDATDAATKAKLAQLKADLAEKEDALQETKDEHTYNLQIDALDDFAASLEDALDDSSKSVAEILQQQKEIVASAKELYQTSSDSVNETLDRLMAFYSGMGTAIDGSDLSTNTGTTGSADTTGTTITVSASLTNATAEALVENTSAVQELKDSVNRAFENGVLVRASDAQLLNVFDRNMLDYLNTYVPPVLNTIQELPEYINQNAQSVQPVVINNHYDCLLNVEGNVDEKTARLLPEQLEQGYQYVTNKMYKQLNILK